MIANIRAPLAITAAISPVRLWICARFPYLWPPALARAGLPRVRSNGMHALRHWYASVLLEAGVSIKALSEYLRQADPGFTLGTFTHLMPSTEARAREAVGASLRENSRGPETARTGP